MMEMILIMSEGIWSSDMKLSLHLDVYLEDTIGNHAGTPEERRSCLG